ncbi:MAG: hypothetical protein ACR2HQ_05565 [Ilumatobacteraceae bacterium]
MTRERGHGAVTLPADYAQAHVRLGYAATEHGYQSDTVTTSIELASSATTRRGLYVAATRGRDLNLICVITDSHDVAEARDVLETILAVDRADVPAVTQRRTLAQQAHQPRPAAPAAPPLPSLTPRCNIPDWFPPLIAQARTWLVDAERQDADYAANETRCATALAAAAQTMNMTAAETAPDWQRHAGAQGRFDDAQRNYDDARRSVERATWRTRRTARRDLSVAEQHLTNTQMRLDKVERLTAPSRQRYARACIGLAAAESDVHNHQLLGMLHPGDRTPAAQRDLDRLETWQR